MNNTKIEWCDSTWNPVTGCLHGCEYCYARRIAGRFGGYDPRYSAGFTELNGNYTLGSNEKKYIRRINGKVTYAPYPFVFEPTFHKYLLGKSQEWRKTRTIFVCSMADLFGDWVPDGWIEQVFNACEKAPQHRYLFLTKNPKRYLELGKTGRLPRKRNFWYGSTVTTPNDSYYFRTLSNSFVSIEPILAHLTTEKENVPNINWMIIGAETGNRKNKVVPKKEWIDGICELADHWKIPVFMKDSLIPIVGEGNMRREFPWQNRIIKN